MCGHSSRRRVAADAHQRPTRRFRHFLGAAWARRAGAQRPPGSWPPFPSLFGLAPCGVYPASGVTVGAVRSYRTFSPLPRRERPSSRSRRASPVALAPVRVPGVAEAVSFLWHWPSTGLLARVPDVIRHTALRSSDFPLPESQALAQIPAATARSSCQSSVYRDSAPPVRPAIPP